MTAQTYSTLADWNAMPYQGKSIRRRAYMASAIMVPGAFAITWGLILAGVIAPSPADKYVSVSLFIGYLSIILASSAAGYKNGTSF